MRVGDRELDVIVTSNLIRVKLLYQSVTSEMMFISIVLAVA